MYIPNSKIQRKITSNSTTFISKADHKPYNGPYIETTNGRFFAGHNNNNVGFELLKKPSRKNDPSKSKQFGLSKGAKMYNIINKDLKTQLKDTISPATSKPLPTENEYSVGFFIRYFLKRINSKFFIEISKDIYDSIYKRENKYDYNLYEIGSLKWYITGNNVHSLNSNTLKTLEPIYSNITYLFPILNEYLRATTEIQENLITQGGELYYSNGKEYRGQYHIHPIKGPMEGATHTSTPHASLYYFKQLPKINNQNYNKFVRDYDKTQCYKCIRGKFQNQIVSTRVSSLVGCPEGTYSTYEEAADACPSKENISTIDEEKANREGGY